MSTTDPLTNATGSRELVITRHVKVSRNALFRCWTEADLLAQWFAPKPWQTTDVHLDVRAGGKCAMTMRGPGGEAMPCTGVYLEVVPDRKLVSTDAFTEAWIPSNKAFMLLELTLEDEGDGTRYTARVRHWSDEDCQQHQAMGFEQGWNQCLDQLIELARTLPA